VFFALIEYFIVLFGIRYDKHWRHKKSDLELQLQSNHAVPPPDKTARLRLFGGSKVHPHHARLEMREMPSRTPHSANGEEARVNEFSSYLILVLLLSLSCVCLYLSFHMGVTVGHISYF
jgi:hypothetical protein